MSEKTEKQMIEEINLKIDKLLYAISLQGKSNEAKVKILSSLYDSNKEIAAISGLSDIDVMNIKARKLKRKNSNGKEEK